MSSWTVIPPSYNEEEFYNYLYDIAISTKDTTRIPDKFFTEVIEYFKSVEQYEKCAILKKLMDEKNKKDEM